MGDTERRRNFYLVPFDAEYIDEVVMTALKISCDVAPNCFGAVIS